MNRDLRLVDHPSGVLALAGIFRPRIYVSRQLCEALTPEQFDAAVAHEAAHHASRDNLKRLWLLLAPGLLPFLRGFDALERAWTRHAEWAADDAAAAGDARRSLALAAALVRVARMETAPSLISPFDGGVDLSARVERLLRVEPPSTVSPRTPAFAAIAIAAAVLFLLSQPVTFTTVHKLLEHLIH
jgi:Zn-dependent protease with chaperone function